MQAAQKAGRGGRVRSEQETAAASSVTVVGKSDSRAQASPAQNGSRAEVGIFSSVIDMSQLTGLLWDGWGIVQWQSSCVEVLWE